MKCDVERVLAYVDAHIYEKISLSELAEVAGYSPFYFSKIFSDTMGMPVTGYIRIRKLQYAIVSLLEGRKVLDVALLYAFDSHEGFTRAFTQLFGSTPSTIKKYLTSYVVPKYVVLQNNHRRGEMDELSTVHNNLHQLVYGYLAQSIEEAKNGFCTHIVITLLADCSIQIYDNGRGLPLSEDLHASKEVLDKILAGSPITNVEYSQMGDLKDADLQIMNSLCESLQIIVTRDGYAYRQDFIRGIAQHDLFRNPSKEENSTVVMIKPDSSIFGEESFCRKTIQDWLSNETKDIHNLRVDFHDVNERNCTINQ